MAKQKKPVPSGTNDRGKRNIIHQLLEEYDIQTTEDIQDALKESTWRNNQRNDGSRNGGIIFGYEKSERSDMMITGMVTNVNVCKQQLWLYGD